jgi:hypothetical protein
LITAAGIRPWCGNISPIDANAWKNGLLAYSKQSLLQGAEGLARQCLLSSAQASYVIAPWRFDNRWGVNNFLHNRDSASMCKNINRLLVGGQGLRGGDPVGGTLPMIRNCCVFCLEAGVRAAETLRHVVFQCPAYKDARRAPNIQMHIASGDLDIFCIHRNIWSWKQSKALTKSIAICSAAVCRSQEGLVNPGGSPCNDGPTSPGKNMFTELA